MRKATRRVFTEEFKAKAVALTRTMPVARAASELSVSVSMLHRWVKQAAAPVARQVTPADHYKFAAEMAVDRGEVNALVRHVCDAIDAFQKRLDASRTSLDELLMKPRGGHAAVSLRRH